MGTKDARIKEWLAEYKSLSDAEIHSYASFVRSNNDLKEALYSLLQNEGRNESRPNLFPLKSYEIIIDPVCHQLFEFYRSKEAELKRFTLEFVPTLIATYLISVSRNSKKSYSGIEALILGIYNLEIVSEDGSPRVYSFTLPSLSKPSIYHEPYSIASLSLSESALSRHDQGETQVYKYGPFPQVDRINAQNRLTVVTFILNSYNSSIGNLSPRSHQTLCRACISLSRTGFENLGTKDLNGPALTSGKSSKKGVKFVDEPRITLSSELLVEMCSGLYFIIYNSNPELGTQAVSAIQERASYELYANVLLVTNAIHNSLQKSRGPGRLQDGEMGLSIALTPSTSTSSFTKNAITNASFRARKLPDDIAVPSDEDDNTSLTNANPPSVVSEDSNEGSEKKEEKSKSSSSKISLKSVLKKGEKKDKDSKSHKKGHVKLAHQNGDSDSNERRVSLSIKGQEKEKYTDNVELKSYTKTSEYSWNNPKLIEEDIGELNDDPPVKLREKKVNQARPNSGSIITDI